MTPSQILANALNGHELNCGPMSKTLGIPRPTIKRALRGARGRPTCAEHHIVLCAFLGIDPVTGACIPNGEGSHIRFDATLFAMAVKMRRFERKQSADQAAKAAGLSSTSYSRIVNAIPTSFESLMRAASAAGIDPRDYTVPVSRVCVTGKTLNENINL